MRIWFSRADPPESGRLLYNFPMEFHALLIEINPWEGRSYEIIARYRPPAAPGSAGVAANLSARRLARFPLGPSALEARLPALRRALVQADLGAGRGSGDDERALEEFALLLHRFLFSGEIRRLLDEAQAAAVGGWGGLRLELRVNAPDLRDLPWEALWDVLSFDLRSLRRGLFDLRVERGREPLSPTGSHIAPAELHPLAAAGFGSPAGELARQADEVFYAADWHAAIQLYEAALSLDPGLGQARESLERAQACLRQRDPATTVPPRAAALYRRAWEQFTQYRFEDALRWLNQAWLLAKDWGIAEWPEAHDFHAHLEQCRAGLADYQQALARAAQGDLAGAIEAIRRAFRADPLEAYRVKLEDWMRIFQENH